MVYGSGMTPFLADVGLQLERADILLIEWMCGVPMKDRRTG